MQSHPMANLDCDKPQNVFCYTTATKSTFHVKLISVKLVSSLCKVNSFSNEYLIHQTIIKNLTSTPIFFTNCDKKPLTQLERSSLVFWYFSIESEKIMPTSLLRDFQTLQRPWLFLISLIIILLLSQMTLAKKNCLKSRNLNSLSEKKSWFFKARR